MLNHATNYEVMDAECENHCKQLFEWEF